MRRVRLGIAACSLGLLQPACAHWALSTEVGVARFAGTARDTAGAMVRPYRPTTFALSLDREFGRTRLGIEGRYAKTGWAAEARGAALVYYDDMYFLEAAPGVSVVIANLAKDLPLRFEGAALLDLWFWSGEEPRWRIGVRVGMGAEWPLVPRLSGSLRISESVMPSVFEPEEVPPDVERLPTWRTSVALALRYRM